MSCPQITQPQHYNEVSTGSGSDRVRLLANSIDLVVAETRSLSLPVLTPWRASQTRAHPRRLFLVIQRSLVSSSSTILDKLDEKRSHRNKQHDMNQAAFVQQEFQDQPTSYHN